MVRAARSASWGSLLEVVTLTGLVVDNSDEAGRMSAERVLSGGIGNTVREGQDILRGPVGAARYLVKGALKGIV